MRIEKFVHESEPEKNAQLFGRIGEFCACATTRDALGCAISSRPGQVWYVAAERHTVHAFGSIRLQGERGLLRHLYSPAGDGMLLETVLRHCIEYARRHHARSVWLTDYIWLESRYAPLGFMSHGNPRGRFVQYVLWLGESNGT